MRKSIEFIKSKDCLEMLAQGAVDFEAGRKGERKYLVVLASSSSSASASSSYSSPPPPSSSSPLTSTTSAFLQLVCVCMSAWRRH